MNFQKYILKNQTYTFLFLFFFGIIFTANSQKQTCTIYFDDNTVVTGLGKIRSDNFIKFKLDKDAESTDYDPMIIDKIIIEHDGVSQIYKYKKEKNGFPLWLKVVTEGKVTLYKNDISGFNFPLMMNNGFGGMNNNFGGMNVTTGSSVNYYVANGEEHEVFLITSLGSITKNFKKAASDFFKDCPILVEKINNKEYKKDDIYNVVKFYNTNCSNENASIEAKIEK